MQSVKMCRGLSSRKRVWLEKTLTFIFLSEKTTLAEFYVWKRKNEESDCSWQMGKKTVCLGRWSITSQFWHKTIPLTPPSPSHSVGLGNWYWTQISGTVDLIWRDGFPLSCLLCWLVLLEKVCSTPNSGEGRCAKQKLVVRHPTNRSLETLESLVFSFFRL